tara:strand:- start:551 stop:739 length:189 start_codon:yes stop_codon:yes gene_type:complete
MNIEELKSLIRELINDELKETSTMGTGASFNAGDSGAYATPFAFGNNKRKKKKGYMGYKELK